MKHIKNKVLMLVMAMVLTVGGIMPVSASTCDEFAEAGSELLGSYFNDSKDGLDLEDFIERNAELAAIGAAAIRMRSSLTLSVPRLLQAGQSWSGDVMRGCSNPPTIGNAGCLITSFAMYLQSIGRTQQTPRTVNNAMGNAACSWNWNTAVSLFGLSGINIMRWSDGSVTDVRVTDAAFTTVRNQIIGSIQGRVPVIVGLRRPETRPGRTNSYQTHFVIAHGFNGTSILIRDPATSNYTTLESHLHGTWRIHRVVAYTTPIPNPPSFPNFCGPDNFIFPCIFMAPEIVELYYYYVDSDR